jgi:hypothetical protein
MNNEQIDYLLDLLEEKKKHINNQYQVVLKSKSFGMSHVNTILEGMEFNNSIIVALERMKKEVDNGVLGLNN